MEALFDVWFVGDTSLNSSSQAFKDMQLKAKAVIKFNEDEHLHKEVIPYFYEYYNVSMYTQLGSAGVRSVLGRILNSLLEAINKRPRLPRYVILLLDKDVIDEVNIWEPEAAVSKNFNSIIMWLCRQVNILIKCKRLEISSICPVAVFGEDPRIIFIKVLRRTEFYPLGCRLGKICAVRTKFNEAINMAAAAHKHNIMNIGTCTD